MFLRILALCLNLPTRIRRIIRRHVGCWRWVTHPLRTAIDRSAEEPSVRERV